MKKLVIAIATALFLATPASAASLDTALAGSEIQRNARDGAWVRYDLWRLSSDGTFTGNYRRTRQVTRGLRDIQTGQVSGRWQLNGDTLCLTGQGLETPGQNCYRLIKAGFSEREYAATNTATGFTWQLFVYNGG